MILFCRQSKLASLNLKQLQNQSSTVVSMIWCKQRHPACLKQLPNRYAPRNVFICAGILLPHSHLHHNEEGDGKTTSQRGHQNHKQNQKSGAPLLQLQLFHASRLSTSSFRVERNTQLTVMNVDQKTCRAIENYRIHCFLVQIQQEMFLLVKKIAIWVSNGQSSECLCDTSTSHLEMQSAGDDEMQNRR